MPGGWELSPEHPQPASLWLGLLPVQQPGPTKELPETHDLVSEVPTRPFPHMVSLEQVT